MQFKWKTHGRKVIGVVLGIIITSTLCLLFPKLIPYETSPGYILLSLLLLPFLFGNIITGYIVRKRGWLYGMLVTCLAVVYIHITKLIALPYLPEEAKQFPFFLVILQLPFGALGGWIGQFFARLVQKNNKENG